MAYKSDKDLVPKIPANAASMLFAEDLVQYVMLLNSPNYIRERDPMPFREFVYNFFDDTIQRAIFLFGRSMEECNRSGFRYMRQNSTISSYTFIRFADRLSRNLVQQGFALGFNAHIFLFHCTTISGMASLFYNHGILNAPVLARTNITNLLEKHMPADGWYAIQRAAEVVLNDRRANETSRENSSSDGINILNQTQDDVNRYGSRNTSQNEEQNLLSETEEKCIEQKIESSCLEYETSLKKLVQRFPGKNSEIDLRPLNMSKSSEDESPQFDFKRNKTNEMSELKSKPRSDASNVNNKPIFIKNERKKIKSSCLKYETSEKKFVQHFSGKNSEIDLRPLNLSKSSEDESSQFDFEGNKCNEMSELKSKPGIDESNINNEPILIESKLKRKLDAPCKENETVESQTLSFREKIMGNSASDDCFCLGPSNALQGLDILDKSDCKINPDPDLNAKDKKSSKTLSFKGDKHTNSSSKNEFHEETSNICQNLSFTNVKKLDTLSNETNDVNCQLIHSEVGESEIKEKLVSRIPNSDQASVYSDEVGFEFLLNKENNANAENISLTDQDESPKLKTSKDSKLERFSPPFKRC